MWRESARPSLNRAAAYKNLYRYKPRFFTRSRSVKAYKEGNHKVSDMTFQHPIPTLHRPDSSFFGRSTSTQMSPPLRYSYQSPDRSWGQSSSWQTRSAKTMSSSSAPNSWGDYSHGRSFIDKNKFWRYGLGYSGWNAQTEMSRSRARPRDENIRFGWKDEESERRRAQVPPPGSLLTKAALNEHRKRFREAGSSSSHYNPSSLDLSEVGRQFRTQKRHPLTKEALAKYNKHIDVSSLSSSHFSINRQVAKYHSFNDANNRFKKSARQKSRFYRHNAEQIKKTMRSKGWRMYPGEDVGWWSRPYTRMWPKMTKEEEHFNDHMVRISLPRATKLAARYRWQGVTEARFRSRAGSLGEEQKYPPVTPEKLPISTYRDFRVLTRLQKKGFLGAVRGSKAPITPRVRSALNLRDSSQVRIKKPSAHEDAREAFKRGKYRLLPDSTNPRRFEPHHDQARLTTASEPGLRPYRPWDLHKISSPIPTWKPRFIQHQNARVHDKARESMDSRASTHFPPFRHSRPPKEAMPEFFQRGVFRLKPKQDNPRENMKQKPLRQSSQKLPRLMSATELRSSNRFQENPRLSQSKARKLFDAGRFRPDSSAWDPRRSRKQGPMLHRNWRKQFRDLTRKAESQSIYKPRLDEKPRNLKPLHEMGYPGVIDPRVRHMLGAVDPSPSVIQRAHKVAKDKGEYNKFDSYVRDSYAAATWKDEKWNQQMAQRENKERVAKRQRTASEKHYDRAKKAREAKSSEEKSKSPPPHYMSGPPRPPWKS